MAFNIVYVSNTVFNNIVQNTKHKDISCEKNLRFENGKYSPKTLFSENCKACTILVVNDFMCHIQPVKTPHGLKNLTSEITDKIYEEKNNNKNVDILVVGGMAADEDSQKTYDCICRICEDYIKDGDTSINATMIVGKTLPDKQFYPMDSVYKTGKTIYINQKNSIPFEESLQKNPNAIKETLNDHYEWVVIAPNHNLSVATNIENLDILSKNAINKAYIAHNSIIKKR